MALHHTRAMLVLARDLAGPCLAPRGSVVAVGALDGLHLGHQSLLTRVAARAAITGLTPMVVSFEPLPRSFFATEPLPRLGSVREKIEGVAAMGMAVLLLLRFNRSLAGMPAGEFVRRVIAARCGAREVWVGGDFRFGHARGGDLGLLQALGCELDFEAHALETQAHGGERISSSSIRTALAAGDFAAAAQRLGRPFSMEGRVVRGQQLGRRLGFPTANIRLGRRVSPLRGIFAVRIHGAVAHPLPGVASLGLRPTVGGREMLLEPHVFDFEGDLYGRHLRVEFVAKLRDEETFASLDDLTRQMHADAAAARAILASLHTLPA